MPAKARAKRFERCVFKDGGRRCVRNGTRSSTNEPPLCNACRIALAAAAAQAQAAPARRAATAVGSIVDDFLHGRPFDPSHIKSAINDFAWGMGGGFTDFRPDIADGPPWSPSSAAPSQGADHRSSPWHREAPPPPPPQDDQRIAERAARKILGFGPSEVITKEILKVRQRTLAMRHHPDRGGSVARMQQINSAVDVLAATM